MGSLSFRISPVDKNIRPAFAELAKEYDILIGEYTEFVDVEVYVVMPDCRCRGTLNMRVYRDLITDQGSDAYAIACDYILETITREKARHAAIGCKAYMKELKER